MSIVKSSKNKDQLLLSGYRYRRANKSQIIWRCCRNDCAGRVRFDGTGYIKVTDHLHAPNPEETISMEFNSNISSGATISHDPPRPRSTTPPPSAALATCNPILCKPSSLPCSSNLDCECFSLTNTVNGTISGICAVADLSCTSMVRCNSDNVTCSIAYTMCVNSTRCQQPVCYPIALANIQICPPSA
ncbi:unnamed protein product [Rotaria sp. Silwood1]|nr:unnamed protein product [Rotaria sp. Silwood1]